MDTGTVIKAEKHFNAHVAAQTVSTVTLEWDEDVAPGVDVFEIEKYHKRFGWQRVAWTSTCRGMAEKLDDNFAYRFRINALKLTHEPGCPSEGDEERKDTDEIEECNCNIPEYITLAVSEEVVGITDSVLPSTMSLYRAIKKGQQFLIKRILRRRPSLINYPAPNGFLPLANAITMGELSVIDIMLTAGANVHIGNPISGRTPLHLAFFHGHLPVARLLLNKKADINVKDNTSMTPCHCAVDANRYDMLKFALDNGADMEAVDLSGWTLLLRAVALCSDVDIVRLLHQQGADLKTIDAIGSNCVQLARLLRNDEALRYLENCVTE